MKRVRSTHSVTSLNRSPQEDADARQRNYIITMTIRIICFFLMAFVTPYGWYTWVFGAGAALLPYIAVVLANAAGGSPAPPAETPVRELPAAEEHDDTPEAPRIITVQEHKEDEKE